MSAPKITAKRKEELEELADMIACYYSESGFVNLEMIAQYYGITYTLNDYKNDFKGLIEYSENSFHIYLDKAQGKNLRANGVRYSFAHELGHFLINEHRSALMTHGMLERNPDKKLVLSDAFEREAEFFASCLLMPRSRVIHDMAGEKFNIDIILGICKKYKVSLLASLSRYVALGNISIMVIVSYANGIFHYKLPGKNFPFHTLNLSSGNLIPAASNAWEYCFNESNNLTNPKVNLAEVWFRPKNEQDALRSFNEYCFPQPAYGKVVSIIWEV